MYLFIVFFYPHHYKTFATATSNTIGGHLGKGKNVQVGIKALKAVYLTLRLFYFPRHCLQPTILNDNVNQFKVGLETDNGHFTLKVKTVTLMSHFFYSQ
jgi:hypothetical protein